MARTWKTAKQLLTITKQFFESPGMSNNVGNAGCMIQKGQQSVSSAKLSSAASVSNKKEHVPQCPFHQAKSQRQIATHTENVGIKPATELPGAPAFPFIGTMYTFFTRRVRERLQEISSKKHQKYGKLYREVCMGHIQVMTDEPALFEDVLRREGKCPIRPNYPSWIKYREHRELPLGLLTSEGEDWQRLRKIIGKRLLKPSHAAEFVQPINEVVNDMIDHLRDVRDPDSGFVPRLTNEMYKWSMESICTIFYGTRMGCLENEMPSSTQVFIDAIGTMFSTSEKLFFFCDTQVKWETKTWKKHVEAWDTIFRVAKDCLDKRIKEINEGIENGEIDLEKNADFLSQMLSLKGMSDTELHSVMSELMLSGTETTSNTLCFAMYLLTTNQHVQEKLYEEVNRVLNGRQATAEDLKNMPYVKNVIKETLRLYPAVPLNARILAEDMVLEGYLVPKDTQLVFSHYAAQRNDQVFERANEFVPERWDRLEGNKAHSFAALPFGFGARTCAGRRFAELELYLALIKVVQQFNLLPKPDLPFKTIYRGVLAPADDMPVLFEDR